MYRQKLSLPSIPEPSHDPRSLQATANALKEAVEVLSGQRGDDAAVRWSDLVRLGVVSEQDVPK